MSGGQVFDRRDGRLVRAFPLAAAAQEYAGALNRLGHRVRQDLAPSAPGNRARYVAQAFAEVGWVATLQRLGWRVEADGDTYAAYPPNTADGCGMGGSLTEGDAWVIARRWHNANHRKPGETKL